MALVQNREDLKGYALRALGHPLITIDITNDQMDDRIDEAIAFFREYYWDGITREYFKHQITAQDIANQFITIPDHIWSVQRVYPVTNSAGGQPNIFDLEYQLRANDLRDISSSSMIYYSQVMSHVALIDNLLNTQRQFRFNRLDGKLHIDVNWNVKMVEGEWILVDAYAALDPVQSPKMWNERLFKEYVICLFKSQWGSALKKYQNIALIGGTTVDGLQLYQEAIDEKKEIEDMIMNNLAPLEMFIG